MPNKPVDKTRAGKFEICVWANQGKENQKKYPGFTLEMRNKEDDGTWTTVFNASVWHSDLLNLAYVANTAYRLGELFWRELRESGEVPRLEPNLPRRTPEEPDPFEETPF